MKKKKILCFDLDNVICTTTKNNYSKSRPKKKIIKFINGLYNSEYYIKIFTSRFMGRSNENIKLARKKGESLTKKQLKNWKLKYHELIMGKPSYDYFVDDKAIGFKNTWSKDLQMRLRKNN